MRKFFLLSLAIISFDQVTKFFFKNKDMEIFRFLSFNYTENTGAAFGILKNQNLFLIIISILVISLIIYYLNKASEKDKLALTFIFAGTFGNLIDRVLHGFVIDFIDFHFWPVFNIADSSNVVGALLLIYFYIEKLNSK